MSVEQQQTTSLVSNIVSQKPFTMFRESYICDNMPRTYSIPYHCIFSIIKLAQETCCYSNKSTMKNDNDNLSRIPMAGKYYALIRQADRSIKRIN